MSNSELRLRVCVCVCVCVCVECVLCVLRCFNFPDHDPIPEWRTCRRLQRAAQCGRFDHLLAEREKLLTEIQSLVDARVDDAALGGSLLAFENNSLMTHGLFQRDTEMLPFVLDVQQNRNVVLWMLMLPEIDYNYKVDVGGALSVASATSERLHAQLQQEVGFSREQIDALTAFRVKWRESVRQAFEANSVLVNVLSSLNAQKHHLAAFQTLLLKCRDDFFALLTPTQQAKTQLWLNK